MKKILVLFLKFGLAAAVVLYLVFRGDMAWGPLRASLAEWQYSVPAFLILALTPFGQTWRWQNLLKSGGLRLPNREVFSYMMVAKFFNMALPGYLSGDILRGFYVFRRAAGEAGLSGGSAGEASKPRSPAVVASILFDRAAGLLLLFLLCLAGLFGSIWYPLPKRLVFSAAVVAGLGVAGMFFLFLLAYWLPRPPAISLRISRWLHCDESVCFLHQVTHYYVRNLRLIGSILGISFLTQGACMFSFILFGFALKVHAPLIAYLTLVPLGLMIMAIPITPAGLGVGQVAFLSLFRMIGTSQGANLYTLYMASFVLINLSGAFLYLSSRISRPAPKPANAVMRRRDAETPRTLES